MQRGFMKLVRVVAFAVVVMLTTMKFVIIFVLCFYNLLNIFTNFVLQVNNFRCIVLLSYPLFGIITIYNILQLAPSWFSRWSAVEVLTHVNNG